jgi:hypothetical protein
MSCIVIVFVSKWQKFANFFLKLRSVTSVFVFFFNPMEIGLPLLPQALEVSTRSNKKIAVRLLALPTKARILCLDSL